METAPSIKWRPQIIVAILSIATLAGLVIILAPDHVNEVVSGAITGIGMLGMKLLESE